MRKARAYTDTTAKAVGTPEYYRKDCSAAQRSRPPKLAASAAVKAADRRLWTFRLFALGRRAAVAVLRISASEDRLVLGE